MRHYQEFNFDDQSFFNQPRRLNKKSHSFKKIEGESDSFEKHRHTYKRAADKSFTRAQLREDQFLF